MYAGATLSIDGEAIAANTRLIASATDVEVMAVVKADGFGHGNAGTRRPRDRGDLARRREHRRSPAAALARESTRPILSWLNAVDADVETAIRHDIDLAVPSVAHLQRDRSRRRGQLGRPGARSPARRHRDVARRDRRRRVVGRSASWPARPRTRGLVRVRRHHEPPRPRRRTGPPDDRAAGCCRSTTPCAPRGAAGSPRAPSTSPRPPRRSPIRRTHFDLVRVGAGLYGIDPSGSPPLRGAMTLSAPVTAVRDVRAGAERRLRLRATPCTATPASRCFRSATPTACPRSLSPDASVLVRGRRVPIAGAVSMDQLVIDVGDLGVQAGDEVVTLFGPGDGRRTDPRRVGRLGGNHRARARHPHRPARHARTRMSTRRPTLQRSIPTLRVMTARQGCLARDAQVGRAEEPAVTAAPQPIRVDRGRRRHLGEHEVSLASAPRSPGTRPARFDVISLTIRSDGSWAGPSDRSPSDLADAVGVLERADVAIPPCTAPAEKTAPSPPCSTSSASPTSARASRPGPSRWASTPPSCSPHPPVSAPPGHPRARPRRPAARRPPAAAGREARPRRIQPRRRRRDRPQRPRPPRSARRSPSATRCSSNSSCAAARSMSR